MTDPTAHSRTALITCIMRTVHSKVDRRPLIDDTWADRLVLPAERRGMAAAVMESLSEPLRQRLLDADAGDAILQLVWQHQSVYASVIFRTRYAEDNVREAAQKSVRQYVIIGAGLDSFGLRRPDFAQDMQVYEIDHPASQKLKRDRLQTAGVEIPPTLHFVPADLGAEDLGAALSRSSYQFDKPAILSWLGVTMYLPRSANLATLKSIANFAAPGSQLIFSYLDQRAFESNSRNMQQIKALAATLGEPLQSGFDPQALGSNLRQVGLTLVEDLSGPELHQRYCPDRTDGFNPGKAGRVALAIKE